MLNSATEYAAGTEPLCYRLKNLVKRLSDGWSITATASGAGQLLSIALLTESGSFHSKITEDDLNALVEHDLVQSHERMGRRYMTVTNYALKAA